METINKLVRIQRKLLQELGREPSPEEIGKEMGLPAERVREIQTVSYTHLRAAVHVDPGLTTDSVFGCRGERDAKGFPAVER